MRDLKATETVAAETKLILKRNKITLCVFLGMGGGVNQAKLHQRPKTKHRKSATA